MALVLRRGILDRVDVGIPLAVCLCALGTSCTFGGGSRQLLPSEFICQLVGVPAVLLALSALVARGDLRRIRPELVLAAAVALVPFLQLIPLPPWAWSSLPGRALTADTLRAATGGLPWRPFSLVPEATTQALLSLALPLAVFLSTLQLSLAQRRIGSLVLLGFGGLNILLGLLQLAQGDDSPLRFYAITNPDLPVGFFANRNHVAAFQDCLLPLCAAWGIPAILRDRSRASGWDGRRVATCAGAAGLGLGIILFEILARSRAGLAITAVAIVLALALAIPYRGMLSSALLRRVLVAGLVLSVACLGGLFVVVRYVLVDASPFDDLRFTIIKGALKALWAYFPFGSGVGSFDLVYLRFEVSADVTGEYINRAHDDIVETVIENGILSVALIAAALARFGWNAWRAWTQRGGTGTPLDACLARACAFVPVLLIAHSLADYPLRTVAAMALLAFALGATVEPLPASAAPARSPSRGRADALRSAQAS